MYDVQLALFSAERNEFVKSEQHGRDAEIVREVRILDEPHGAVQQNDDIESVQQLVGGPECREDVSPGRSRRKDVNDADDDNQQYARETCARLHSRLHFTVSTQ